MPCTPISSWHIDGETVGTVTNFILGGSKITADGDFSHEIKRHLLLGRKVKTNLHPMDRGAWWAAVHGVAKSRTWLSDFTFNFRFHALEKEMVTHSSILAGENLRDGSTSWAAIYGVAQSWAHWSNLAAAADSILKSRDITLSAKVRLVKAMVFPVVMYGCQSWTIKKAEHQRIDAFELWCWRRLFRVPCTARRSN